MALTILPMVADFVGLGTSSGFGGPQVALLLTGLGLIAISFVAPIHWNVRRSNLSIVITSTLFAVVMCDVLMRLHFPPSYVVAKYGWNMAGNKTIVGSIEDTTGQFRQVTVRYFQHGFKRWGDPTTDKLKVLVFGDSVTEAKQVSNGEEWYAHLERQFPSIELFVHGGGGYGSLQEFMVLDDHIDRIQPDLILWQFCTNDYTNNLFELDALSYPNNNFAFRPYLEEDKIVFRLPLLYPRIREYSSIADRLLKAYDVWRKRTLDLNGYLRSRARLSEAEKERLRVLDARSHDVTLKIMKRVRERAKATPIYLFNGCGPLTAIEYRICSGTNIVCIPEVYEHVSGVQRGEVRVPNDGHWNVLGNRLLGETLAQYFQKVKLVKVKGRACADTAVGPTLYASGCGHPTVDPRQCR